MVEILKVMETEFERRHECRDIVKRLGVISPSRTHIKNHPVGSPIALFNATGLLRGDHIEVYARMIMGYYMYVSAIVRIPVPVEDILSGNISDVHYTGEIVIYPSTRYDIWGTEDPRVTQIGDLWLMVYSGRTVNYFNPLVRQERVLPVVASSKAGDGRSWRRLGVFTFPKGIREKVVSDKDAFLMESPTGRLLLFHRPHFTNEEETYHLVVSRVNERRDILNRTFGEAEVGDTIEILKPAPFERSLGWCSPPIEVEPGRYVTLVHATDRKTQVYRAFALLFRFRGDEVDITSITPTYIFEPKEMYEVYGDRPMVVFPCGLIKLDDEVIVTYGAGDYVVGFGLIELSELLSLLEA
ncbi:MAG: glycosidase [Thermoprotei archaeon]|nr:glycosidase [Thermoprotei archaeon]